MSDHRSRRLSWGLQLPIQSQSSIFVQPWESSAGPKELAEVAIAAEQAGAGYIAVCDHAAIPHELTAAMGETWYDTIATLAWLAAQTERIALMSHIYVLPYRSPVLAAKSFATLDLLSGGRSILGVGAGHVEAEFELLGADFAARGSTLNDGIAVVREIFETGSFGGAVVAPRSPRPGGVPIWVGGSSKAAIDRAIELGDGWLPQGPPKMGMADAVEYIGRRRDELGKDPHSFTIGTLTEALYVGEPGRELSPATTAREPEALGKRLAKYLAVGAHQIQVRFDTESSAELVDQIGRFGSEVWPVVLAES